MSGKLAAEIQQKGFPSVEEEAALNIFRTAEVLHLKTTEFMKQYGLSTTQFNVLRILRGAGKSGLACSQIADRMITRDPDITRLLDRMEAAHLVTRERSSGDRRVVVAKITDDALKLLSRMDKPLTEMMRKTMGKLKRPALLQLIGLLEDARASFS